MYIDGWSKKVWLRRYIFWIRGVHIWLISFTSFSFSPASCHHYDRLQIGPRQYTVHSTGFLRCTCHCHHHSAWSIVPFICLAYLILTQEQLTLWEPELSYPCSLITSHAHLLLHLGMVNGLEIKSNFFKNMTSED